MARMHSGGKGRSRSRKPVKRTVPVWVSYDGKKAEMIIAKLAKEGKTSAEIGILLRDTYGIPDARSLTKKRISRILAEKHLAPELPEDMLALIRRSVILRKHIEANKKDETSKRGLLLTESKIKRLTKYYKRTGKVASDWKYDPARAGFFMK